MSKVTFNNRNNEFYISLKESVDSYFIQHGIKKTGDWRLFSKTIILISSALVIYLLIVAADITILTAFALSGLLGFLFACIGFAVMHDANHGSYCSNQKINDFIGLSANLMGASSYFWKQKHNIIHHTYTNVDGLDDDIAKSPVIRQCESQKWVPAHRVQHFYLPIIYSLSSVFWIFFMDFTKYFTRRIYRTEAWKMTLKNHIIFWVTKIHYAICFIIIPIMVWGGLNWFIGFLFFNAVMGITLSFVFQLAHVVENTEFEHIPLDETKHIETAWAIHQLRTTANFAMSNKIISWFVGGLNFQIEHHLFPRISHIHYPAISNLVREKCDEFNLPYNEYTTMSEALASHFRVMRELGVNPQNRMMKTQQAA